MYTEKNIDDYMKRITKEQVVELVKHCNDFGIAPEICAWYEDKEDFYQDWIKDNKICKTKKEADALYDEKVSGGEFKQFKDGKIVRLVY